MNHVERDARLDQRLVKTERVVLDLGARLLAAIKRGRLLRIDHRHARERPFVPQISFVAVVPAVQVLDHFQPAAVDAPCR